MEIVTHEGKTFEKIVYAEKVVKGREFQSCIFNNCDFSNSDFSYNKFLDCTFNGCNLSLMKLHGTTLNNTAFKNCKILGVNFSECDDFLFTVRFENCVLNYASFMGKKMAKTKFVQTDLKEVSFAETNLTGSVFDQTDLTGAIFNNTNLTLANLVTAYNYAIDPQLNIIKKASFSLQDLPGLLTRFNIKIV